MVRILAGDVVNLLLVEDDLHFGRALHEVLLAQQYRNTWVRDALAARRFLDSESFDLALLDIVLPGESGLDLLMWMRASGKSLPVMMLTARDAVTDRVLGLDSGADDYLPKPFAMEEFLSRVRSLLRRRGEQRAATWLVGDLSIDTVDRRVSRNGVSILLTPREFALLLALAARPGKVMTRAELARGSEAQSPEEGNAVDVQIHSLRKKLGPHSIGTLRGVGYFLEETLP